MSLPRGRLSTEENSHVIDHSADSAGGFLVKLEPTWSMEEDPSDQSSAVYSPSQPMSNNTSLLSLNLKHLCYLCPAAFVLISRLELHLASVHGEKLHVVLPGSSTPDRCDVGNCSSTDIDKEVENCSDRNTEVNKVDGDGDEDGKNRSKHHMCDVCGKSLSNPRNLKRHKIIHSDVKPFKCDECDKGFYRACHLKTHKLTHGGDKAFVCNVCSKTFALAFTLTQHNRIHTGERPYKCPHCDTGFHQPGSLQHHIKSVHQGVKPHVCDVCGAAFSERGGLTIHKRIHTGEKPHVCSDCGKGFASSSALLQHRPTHTGAKTHVCSDCGKGFSRSSSLSLHRMTHTGEKPCRCSHCPAAFTTSYSLKLHTRAKH